jgi:hypothetical protein
VSKGPLAVRWGAPPWAALQAGTTTFVAVELTNAGTLPWSDQVFLASHWLDDRDNPIVWDGPRNVVPPLAPGESASVEAKIRMPIPPGRYRLAFDMVAELRAWFSELGSPMLTHDVEVGKRDGDPNATLPTSIEPAPEWEQRVRAAHAEGFGVVAGAIDWAGSLLHRPPRELAPYAPGPGRVPGFSSPLLCPSVLPGIELEPLGEVAGLPAFAAPQGEPWVYDGRIVLHVRR